MVTPYLKDQGRPPRVNLVQVGSIHTQVSELEKVSLLQDRSSRSEWDAALHVRKRSDLLMTREKWKAFPMEGLVWTGSQVASQAGPWTYSVQ